MATEPPELRGTSQISIEKLISPLSRCILLVVLLSTSTGLLVRQLIGVTLKDLLALSVGVVWFLGDLLPTISLLVLLHDILLSGKKDETKEIFRVNGRPVTTLDCIIIIFSLLYLIDLIVTISCYLGSFRHQNDDCQNLLRNYRYTFFHIQTIVAILYFTRPWRWSRLDLRKVLVDAQKFIKLVSAIVRSLLQRITPSKSDDSVQESEDTQKDNAPIDKAASISTRGLTVAEAPSTLVDPQSSERVDSGSLQSSKSGPRAGNSKSSSSTRKRRSITSKGVVLVVKQTAMGRGGTLRQQSRKHQSSRGSSASQIVISRSFGGRSSKVPKSFISEDHLCTIQPDATRTVNLNLNMN